MPAFLDDLQDPQQSLLANKFFIDIESFIRL